jgi:hypothetical protein
MALRSASRPLLQRQSLEEFLTIEENIEEESKDD